MKKLLLLLTFCSGLGFLNATVCFDACITQDVICKFREVTVHCDSNKAQCMTRCDEYRTFEGAIMNNLGAIPLEVVR